MRKEFAKYLHDEMSYNESIVLLTGDLGYGLWDQIKIDYPDRFINFLLLSLFFSVSNVKNRLQHPQELH